MTIETLHPVSNGASGTIAAGEPYSVDVTIEGTASLLFHRWNNEAVASKAAAAKGSKAKKSDDVESYVARNQAGEICLPGEYIRMAIVGASKFRQDPRSPRKSAMDLYKAALIVTPDLCSLGTSEWDYLDSRRVQVMRAGITRVRPAFLPGWRADATVDVLLPEYVAPDALHEVLSMAGRLIGVGDFRPTFGRFQVVRWEVRRI